MNQSGYSQYSYGTERSPFLPFMLLVTIVYLSVEFMFNARLVDLALGTPTDDELHWIEVSGRLISGCALTLWVWGVSVLPRFYGDIEIPHHSIKAVLPRLAMTAAIVMSLTYYVEKRVFDWVAEHLNPDRRIEALYLEVLTRAASLGGEIPDDLVQFGVRLDTPVGRALLAGYPLVAYFQGERPVVSEAALRNAIQLVLKRQLGTPTEFRNGVFRNSYEKIRYYYEEYRVRSEQYLDSLSGTSQRQNDAWASYVTELGRHGWAPDTVPPIWRWSVRQRIRKAGISIPSSWRPDDKVGFMAAVAETQKRDAGLAWSRGTRERLGAELPPMLTWPQFVASAPVQAKWRAALGYPGDMTLKSDLPLDVIESGIMAPIVKGKVAVYFDQLSHMEIDRPYGVLSVESERAMEVVLAFGFAIVLSTVAILVHIFKVANYLVSWFMPFLLYRSQLLGFILCGLIIINAMAEYRRTQPHFPSAVTVPWGALVTNGSLYPVGRIGSAYWQTIIAAGRPYYEHAPWSVPSKAAQAGTF